MNPFDRSKYSEATAKIIQKTIYENPYVHIKPYPRQLWPIFEVTQPEKNNEAHSILAGGGGYGGKTYLGSMLAAQYLHFPEYQCLVTRKNRKELIGPNSIWRNLKTWLTRKELGPLRLDPRKDINKSELVMTAPSGATIWFRFFDEEESKGKLQSESYERIIHDEGPQLKTRVLKFSFRSLRHGISTCKIPLSMIILGNPSDEKKSSNEYVTEEYVDGKYPYFWMDWRHNPFAPKTYKNTLDKLDFIDQKYQKDGDWHYRPSKGDLINRETIKKQVTPYNKELQTIFNVLSIDLAGEGSDKTAITNYLYLKNGWGFIEDLYQTISPYPEEHIYRFIESKIISGFSPNLILIEQEGGSKVYSDRHWEEELSNLGIPLYPITPKGSKYNRARPFVREMNKGLIKINKSLENKIDDESKTQSTYLNLLTEELLNLEPVMKVSPNLIDCLSQARNFIDSEVLVNNNSGMQIARA